MSTQNATQSLVQNKLPKQTALFRQKIVFSIAIVTMLASFLVPNQTALAANITVDTTADELNADGDCSLREAIQSANTDTAIDACLAGSGADTIVLSGATYTLNIAGTGEDANMTGDLDIIANLSISGTGNALSILDGGGIDRVLEIHPGATVHINAVTIRNGNPGANAGGIMNRGTATLGKSVVSNNTGLDFGGGIYNLGTMTIANSTIKDNVTNGPNLSGGGGGIFNQGSLTLAASTVNNNSTLGRGGAMYNLDLPATLTNSTLSGNVALNGGGIFNRFGTVTVTNTTTALNTATDNGGGIWNLGGTLNLANSVLSSNTTATTNHNYT